MAINLDATRLLLDKIRSLHTDSTKPPIFLYTSSGAAYGGELPASGITDATTPAPQGSYGTQKVICEYLCYEYSRRGWIDARIVRLPTIMVRPVRCKHVLLGASDILPRAHRILPCHRMQVASCENL